MGPENYLRCSTAKRLARGEPSFPGETELDGRKRLQSSMRALSAIFATLAFVSAAYCAPAQPSSNAAAQPAAWLQHDLIVSLHNLPRTYSCDDLWYKFRDVLLEIGARADYKILPYDCNSRSPQVQL